MLNLDFTQRLAISLDDEPWMPSPSPGVTRRRLEREEAESGRATSMVRYAPGSRFPSHVHGGGEEFLVLEGTFSDDSGDFPAGTYVRNPIGSKHAPASAGGCTIFVKLCQMHPSEQEQTVVDTTAADAWVTTEAGEELALYASERERVRMLRPRPNAAVTLANAELFVTEGALELDGETLPAPGWLRIPPGEPTRLKATAGTTLWVKTGHLPEG